MAIPWGAIAGGASALAGLFGGSDDEDQVQTQSVDYKAMVKAAQKAGFNPLTALRNGGAAGFTTTTMPALSSPSVIDRVANAVGSFAQGMDNQQRWDASQHRQALENRMIEAQTARIMGIPSRGATPGIGGDIPPARHGTKNVPVPAAVQTGPPPAGSSDYYKEAQSGDAPPGFTFITDTSGRKREITNPENPVELEQEAGRKTITGDLLEWGDELLDRNIPFRRWWPNLFEWSETDQGDATIVAPDWAQKFLRAPDLRQPERNPHFQTKPPQQEEEWDLEWGDFNLLKHPR